MAEFFIAIKGLNREKFNEIFLNPKGTFKRTVKTKTKHHCGQKKLTTTKQ